MEQPFIVFSIGSVLFFVDRTISTLIYLNYLPIEPYTLIFLSMETVFVLLLTSGFLLLYRNWMRVQRRIPERTSLSIPQ